MQIFDSWAGLIPREEISGYCYQPNLKIVEFCKKIEMPVICFPKGINKKYKEFLDTVKPNGLNIDYDVDLALGQKKIKNVCLQGGNGSSNFYSRKKKNIFLKKY